MSKFKKLKAMLERKGYKESSAGAIAAHIGRQKYGKEAMKKAAVAHKPASNYSGKK